MIDQLPVEIVLQIAGHLPTLSSILNLSSTNKPIRSIIQKEFATISHSFVERYFPSIPTQPPWQKAAFDLTSRSRAFDRHAFLAWECMPPAEVANRPGTNERRFGVCAPVIDSYETQSMGSTGNKQILAWSVAGRLWLRAKKDKSVSWSPFITQNDLDAVNDILDLRLMRPHQNNNPNEEKVLIRRANGEMSLLGSSIETGEFKTLSLYRTLGDSEIDCLDVCNSIDPRLVVCNSRTLRLYSIHSPDTHIPPSLVLDFTRTDQIRQRMRCVKFMGERRIAVGVQYLEGKVASPIHVFDLETATTTSQLQTSTLLARSEQGTRTNANVLVNLNEDCSASNISENLLLTGSTDGHVRLYDLRTSQWAVQRYLDPIDDGQTLSLVAIGREKVFAGSHQNACLKMFDMRMGAALYHHTGVKPVFARNSCFEHNHHPPLSSSQQAKAKRGINIFLSVPVHHSPRLWKPLPRKNAARSVRYRGSIYSLSSPSSSSRTLFAGIENHVIQLEFVNTDDFVLNRGNIRNTLNPGWVFNLSCYQRPREGLEHSDTVLLRSQADWSQSRSRLVNPEPGWDQRWRLNI